jgi:hypothetical protein
MKVQRKWPAAQVLCVRIPGIHGLISTRPEYIYKLSESLDKVTLAQIVKIFIGVY